MLNILALEPCFWRVTCKGVKEDRRHDLACRIERLDAEIDALVYELYGLTEGERAIIERD